MADLLTDLASLYPPDRLLTRASALASYESDGLTYVMYGLGNIIPRSTSSSNYYYNTGIRTNIPEKVQSQ